MTRYVQWMSARNQRALLNRFHFPVWPDFCLRQWPRFNTVRLCFQYGKLKGWIRSPRSDAEDVYDAIEFALPSSPPTHILWLEIVGPGICTFLQVDTVHLQIGLGILNLCTLFVLPALVFRPTYLLRAWSSCSIWFISRALFAMRREINVNDWLVCL